MNFFSKYKKIIFSSIFFVIAFFVFFVLPTNHAEAATRTWRGTTDSNWGTDTNWLEGAVPLSTDDVVFDASSPACTVNTSTRAAKTLDFSAYTNTITMSAGIAVSGSITFGTSMTISGGASLIVNDTSTLTSNGVTWPNSLTFQGLSKTHTFADDWHIGAQLILSGTTALILNGSNVYIGTNLTSNTTATTSGTTNLIMNGTGTWSNSSTGKITNNLTFNTAGTISIVNNVRYSGGTMTYTAGTMNVGATSFLVLSAASTLNTGGMTWNNVTVITASQTITLLSDLNIGGNAAFGATTINVTINGAYNVNVLGNMSWVGTTGTLAGSATIVLNGTGNWSMPNITTGSWNIATVINTSGTYTLTSNILFGNTTAALTYTAGTFVTTGYYLRTGIMVLDMNGLTIWGLSISTASGAITQLASDLVISNSFINADSASHMTIKSNSAGTQRKLTLLPGATHDLRLLDATDIDSSEGQTIWSYGGVLSNATNWKDSSLLPTIAYVFVF
ncbi:MAG: hypothetical protein WAV10_00780 [Minisyncoccia bacterium]